MKINEALGVTGKIRRVGWDFDIFARLEGALSFKLYKSFGDDQEQLYGGEVTLADIMAVDWEPVYERSETLNIIQAMNELANGAKIIKRIDTGRTYRMNNERLYPTHGGDGCSGPSAVSLTMEFINAQYVVVQ